MPHYILPKLKSICVNKFNEFKINVAKKNFFSFGFLFIFVDFIKGKDNP